MNFLIPNLPQRNTKPRNNGLTMVIDTGLSTTQATSLLEVAAPYVDVVKLGWTTSCFTANLREKLQLYKEGGVVAYFGGTLFEAFIVRNAFDAFRRLLDTYGITHVEVSDGSLTLPHEEKCRYIATLSKTHCVFSEVGSKDNTKIIPPYLWIKQMQAELEAGAEKVIGEARESGTTGLFRTTGEVREGLVDEILTQVPAESIIWEAPQKAQQVWFIERLGSNVNLGNIQPEEVIGLETMRLGLRGDTFYTFFSPPT